MEMLGDDVPEEEIQKLLKAASDENISEEDFDRLVDDFILKNRS
jgi:Ca2+-binding EF-hand superfamily protein